MPTVAEIAALALGAVDSAIPDAVHQATLSWSVNPLPDHPQMAYNPATGTYTKTSASATGRLVVVTEKAPADIFPDYVAGPGDELLMLEGFTACKEGWTLTGAGKTWHIRQVQDILAAGSLFYVVAREVKA
jgi:hypothetical protein